VSGWSLIWGLVAVLAAIGLSFIALAVLRRSKRLNPTT
jgi:hypothetical protein